MPLDEYQAKRDFSATPEPATGTPTPEGQPRRFVIQQHHATAMHYDFRLELDGVLMSWAVPKGPSYDPKDKRLAVHVEDHPLDYAGFEGVIPKGEYGGGNVIVWDRGTWDPITDPHAGLAKGDFKFHLNGEKLNGGWVLVRLKPRPGEKRENWLLIKERDDAARPSDEYNVTVAEPFSVVSGVRVDEIGSVGVVGQDDGMQVHGSSVILPDNPSSTSPPGPGKPQTGAATAPSPPLAAQPVEAALVAPPELALCTLATDVPATGAWIGELKYDGYRMTVALRDGVATCYSRNGEDLTAKVAPVAAAVEALPATDALIDGEIVVFDERGASRFGLLQEALGGHPENIVLVAFDLLYLNGYDLTPLPTATRKELLSTLIDAASPSLSFAHHVEGDLHAFMEAACAQGLEGIVAKRADAAYPRGRTRTWIKVKCRRSQEFVVGGYTVPEGNRVGFGALLLGYYQDGALVYAGRAGSGFTDKQLETLRARLDELHTDTSPFATPPSLGKECVWVEPTLVAQVAFAEWTSEGLLRQPSFLGLRDDIDPTSIVRETPVAPDLDADTVAPAAADAPPPSEPANSTSSSAEGVSVLGVRISNPQKNLFPDSEFPKADLAAYYQAIAPLMLPEVAGRPLTLVRCPVGDGRGKCFYQRHPDRGLAPQIGVLSHTFGKRAETFELLWIEDAAGLVALAQMGVAEIHTWLSRTDAPARPDRLIFDLDPGDDVGWEQIVETARMVRDEVAELGFVPFVKSTGSKGLHVVMPIEPVWEFGRVHDLAKAIAERIAQRHPDAVTPKMAKALRPGRIFLDYVRNSEGASAVAPYSTRYLEGPPVAVPLSWDELDGSDDIRRRYTPARVLERMVAGVDPWAHIDDDSVGARILKAAEKAVSGE